MIPWKRFRRMVSYPRSVEGERTDSLADMYARMASFTVIFFGFFFSSINPAFMARTVA